jgi:hypothetical protein
MTEDLTVFGYRQYYLIVFYLLVGRGYQDGRINRGASRWQTDLRRSDLASR